MRQLLILAIETPDALSIDHLALQVPRLIQNAKASGVIINGTVKPSAIAAAAKACVEKLAEGEHNVPVYPEQTAGEIIEAGFRQTMVVLDRHERMIQENARYQVGVLGKLFGGKRDGTSAS